MDHIEKIDSYIDGVMSGSIPTGRLQKLAVKRHLYDLETQASRPIAWEPARAERGCSFFPLVLRHTKGEWYRKPFELTPSQAFILGSVHGWRRPSGLRRFTRAYCEVGRKYGKSEVGAGCALQMGVYDDPVEPGAWINLCATKEDQVRDTTFGQAVKMVEASPWLRSKIQTKVKRLIVSKEDLYQPNSVITPVGSDSTSSDGFDTSGAVLDELHAWRKHHHELYSKMTTAGGSRRQELVWFWTTAGDDKSELWLEVRQQFVAVLEAAETDEIVADHLFGFIACIDTDDEPLDLDLNDGKQYAEFERIMTKSNPNYPLTPKPDYLRERAMEAQSGGPIEQNKFLRFHANRMVSSSVKPFPADEWTKLATLTDRIVPKNAAVGAWDLGRSSDFAAWAIVWIEDEMVKLFGQSYTCADRPQSLQTAQMRKWIEQGHLIECPGDQVDFVRVEQDIVAAHEEYGVTKWAFDPSFASVTAQQVAAQIGEDLVGKWIQSHRQYNEACRKFLSAFKSGKVQPDASPCLRWQARNTAFVSNARDEWMPDKGIGPEYKIDQVVASLMAYGYLILEPPDPPSVYEERGMLVF